MLTWTRNQKVLVPTTGNKCSEPHGRFVTDQVQGIRSLHLLSRGLDLRVNDQPGSFGGTCSKAARCVLQAVSRSAEREQRACSSGMCLWLQLVILVSCYKYSFELWHGTGTAAPSVPENNASAIRFTGSLYLPLELGGRRVHLFFL